MLRKFVEEEIKPNVDTWIKTGYPNSLHKRAYELGIAGIIYPPKYGGCRPEQFDPFYELITIDELTRSGSGGVLSQMSIDSMALPPILKAGSEELKEKVCRPVILGDKHCCLAISEPTAGSDVANIKATAKREGDYYIVNGMKKWITGGMMADFFTTAVRTGTEAEGAFGISLLLIERNSPGVHVRPMQTQFDNASSTTFVTFEDVKVPVSHLIGEEGSGFMLIMTNFNHERFVISTGACRLARIAYEESFKYALNRKTFGKRLVDHQLIRFKLAEMARQIEALFDNVERVCYQFKMGVPDSAMGGQCALLKVQASKTLEFCAREASQIFGGNSIVKEGLGKIVERLYRDVRAQAIPGGSEEILLDLALRQSFSKSPKPKF
jgi:alkylation response protein AidB-like acyl-CoA dehydrogenase